MKNVEYTFNRIIQKLRTFSPIELFFGHKTKTHFFEFGAAVYLSTRKSGKCKNDPRAHVVRFLCVDDNA
jgi:hypothetical protein